MHRDIVQDYAGMHFLHVLRRQRVELPLSYTGNTEAEVVATLINRVSDLARCGWGLGGGRAASIMQQKLHQFYQRAPMVLSCGFVNFVHLILREILFLLLLVSAASTKRVPDAPTLSFLIAAVPKFFI